jgi:phage gp46-like protein
VPGDVRTAWAPLTYPWGGDWLIEPPGLATAHNLETAVLLSLLTEASARPDDELPDFGDYASEFADNRRGWWANQNRPEGYALGSRLWLLSRTVSTEETRQRAEEICEEALAWMLDDGVAARVTVAAAYLDSPPFTLGVTIELVRGTGERFAWAWDELAQDGLATRTVIITVAVSPTGIRPIVGELPYAV